MGWPDTTSWWTAPIITGTEMTPWTLTRAVAVLVGAWFVSLLLRRTLDMSAAQRQIDASVRYSLTRLVHLTILLVALSIAVATMGVDLQSLTVVAGALGLGIGFGLQSVAANFVAGLVLLFERPIRVGDRISLGTLDTGAVDAINGYVQSIRLRSTRVVTPDNITLIVPNLELVTRTVVNWSLGEMRIRIRLQVSVAQDSDPDRVRAAMEDVARAHPGVLNDPAAEVRMLASTDSGLVFQLLVWIPDPRQRGRVESDLRWALVRRFREDGIVMPFPQRDIRIVQDGSGESPGRAEPPSRDA